MIFNTMPTARLVEPKFNVGGLLDIPTGRYLIGKHGESILNSGLSFINSVIGPQNSFKTALLSYLFFTVFARYVKSGMNVYDTENSLDYSRLESIASQFSRLNHLDFNSEEIASFIQLVKASDMIGDDWFEAIKNAVKELKKAGDKNKLTTPFLGFNNKPVAIPAPILVMIDSLSQFKVSSVEDKIVDKNAIGESGANTQFMKEAAAKAQLISQLPNVTAGGHVIFGMVAHVGKKIEMDQYAPKDAKLAHSRRGANIKGVTEKFEFINNNLFEIFSAKPLYNSSSDKTAKYPFNDSDRLEGTVDLMLCHMVNTRNKGGPSGFNFNLIVSQTRGFQPTLTEFHYIKETADRFGISGNNISFSLDLYPDCKLGRTTICQKIAADEKLCRAIEITSQMAQMQRLWSLDSKYICTPKELYDSLVAKGYDWDVLLNTRGWWCFEEQAEGELPFLSTMDLLRMRTGEYHPYWMEPLKENKND